MGRIGVMENVHALSLNNLQGKCIVAFEGEKKGIVALLRLTLLLENSRFRFNENVVSFVKANEAARATRGALNFYPRGLVD